ncbi:unnamed protein product, partial [Iphiclides podalirius]
MITMFNGRKYYLYKGYTYCLGSKSSLGCRWRCTKAQCRAIIILDEEGKLFLENGEHRHNPNKYHRVLHVQRIHILLRVPIPFGVPLALHEQVPVQSLHHAGQRWKAPCEELKMITLVNGKRYYLYKGYTYCVGSKSSSNSCCRWRCTNTSDCYASIILDSDGNLLLAKGEHTHKSHKYHVMANGRYVRI